MAREVKQWKPWYDENYIGFDVETSGEQDEYALQAWRVRQPRSNLTREPYQKTKAWMTSLVWMRGPNAPEQGCLNPDIFYMREMLETAIKEKRRIVGWNVPFDIGWLIAYGLEDLVFQVKWLDGMLLWKHAFIEPEYNAATLESKRSYGLKSCVKELWPDEAGYEEGVDFFDASQMSRTVLHDYNIRDVRFTLRAAKHWWEKLSAQQQRCALIQAELLPWVAKANVNGLPLDPIILHELDAELKETMETKMTKLFVAGATPEIIASTVKLRDLLYITWGLPIPKLRGPTATRNQSVGSTDKVALFELANGWKGYPPNPQVRDIIEYKQAKNAKTKFCEGPLASLYYNGDYCSHPQAKIFGTYTLRVTYASGQGKGVNAIPIGWAIAQTKRDKRFRAPLIAPPGCDIVEFDAAGQEFRWMAVASGDPIMLQLCQPGEDPHSYLGSQIARCDYRKLIEMVAAEENFSPEKARPWTQRRLVGKVGNLSLQYRTSAPRLRETARIDYNMPMTDDESVYIRNTYLKTYRFIEHYWRNQIALMRQNNYAETLAGSRVRLNWGGNFELLPSITRWGLESTAINYRIQGTGAEQKYLALAYLQVLWKKYNACFAWDLHDGIYSFVPKEHSKQFAAEGKAMLDNLNYKAAWGINVPVPMPWDCKIGQSWGTLKGFHP